MPTPNAGQVVWGPGKLYVAPIGTAEPATIAGPWINWYRLGYTVAGTTISYSVTTADISVAEEVDPIASIITDRNVTIAFQFAEFSMRNLQLAMSGAVADDTAVNGSAWNFEAPTFDAADERVMLGWDSDTGDRRYIFRRCFQTGAVSWAAVKGATLTGLDASFKVEVPQDGKKLFKVFGSAALNASSPKITS